MSNEVVHYEPQTSFNELSVKEHISQRNRMIEIMEKVMKKDVHYGTIPGTDKPTLYKPGAERILMTFALSPGKEEEWPMQDLSNDHERRYRFMVPIYHRPSGAYIGFGVGECSSEEDKFAWRKAVCEEEFAEWDEGLRREKWKYGKNGTTYKVKQIHTNPADIANNVLKIAKKRALIDATLTTTGASEVFTQDVEDMPEELREVVGATASRPSAQAKAKPSQSTAKSDVMLTPKYGPCPGIPITEAKIRHLKVYGNTALDKLEDQTLMAIDPTDTAEEKAKKEKRNAVIQRNIQYAPGNQALFDAIDAELQKRAAAGITEETEEAESPKADEQPQ